MRLSETIITFGSTIGVEATYMGKIISLEISYIKNYIALTTPNHL